jgi:hypothetical protein
VSSRSSSFNHVPRPAKRLGRHLARILLVATVAASGAAGCAPPAARPAPFRARPDSAEVGTLLGPFNGRVIDSATNSPVAGALVYATWSLERGDGLPAAAGFREHVASTDSNGAYRIPLLTSLPGQALPGDARITGFSLLIYKRGFIAYRSDRRFGDLGPRFDFAQRSNQVLLERWRDDLSHARHLRFVGGGAAVTALTQWELADAAAELDGRRAGSDLRPGRGNGPYLVAAQLLSESDIKARTRYDGNFETGPLSDEADTATYSSQHYKAMGRAESWDVALRMWRLGPEGAQERYDELLTQLPSVDEKDTIATRSFVSSEKEIRGVGFLDAQRGIVVLLTCGSSQCSSIDDAAALAETIRGRIERLFVITPTGTPATPAPTAPSPQDPAATPAPAAPTDPAPAPATVPATPTTPPAKPGAKPAAKPATPAAKPAAAPATPAAKPAAKPARPAAKPAAPANPAAPAATGGAKP